MGLGNSAMFCPFRLVFIGVGGIGSWIVEPVCRYFMRHCRTAVLVDGDVLEPRNLERQSFASNAVSSYKVHSLTHRLRTVLPTFTIVANPVYVGSHNVHLSVLENDLVVVAPDNHEARRTVAERAKGLKNIAVFTAGNELYDGSVHVYVKLHGIELSRDFIQRHPEAVDKAADDRVSCDEAIDRGDVQLIAVNFLMAAMTLVAVHTVFRLGAPRSASEIWSAIPQELYGCLGGEVDSPDAGPRMRASMAVQSTLAKEAVCTS